MRATPEMIEAGVSALMERELGDATCEEVVAAIFEAMLSARKTRETIDVAANL